MYDHLDPLFFRHTPTSRHSEPVDTHMAIQRHEQPYRHPRRKQSQHKEPESTLWEDSTRMSVAMLRAFLQNLLAAQKPQRPDTQADDQQTIDTRDDSRTSAGRDDHTGKGQQETKHTNPAERIAQAYQDTARAVHDSNYDPWAATGPAIPDDAPTLNDQDKDVVRTMIRDLEKLEARYIETLEIRATTNFLQAILDAIDRAMGRNQGV